MKRRKIMAEIDEDWSELERYITKKRIVAAGEDRLQRKLGEWRCMNSQK